jgi:phosphatidylserine decarboxylase
MIPDLLARNERVACLFETSSGPMALVLIGALFVGSIETVWEGAITPPYRKVGQHWNYGDGGQRFSFLCVQGQEVGRFNMGSAVVLLFPACSVSWGTDLCRGKRVVVGQQIGSFLETP